MKQRLTLEVIAPTVEEAIEKGLEELGLEANEVDVEVLDEGKRNIFRFAARQARVRLTVKESVMAGAEPAKEDPLEEEEYELDPEEAVDADDIFESEIDEIKEFGAQAPDLQDIGSEEEAILLTVRKILDLMGTKAEIKVEPKVSEDDQREFYGVDIQGDDLSYLIGRRSETLNAIQYIVSLIISHRFNRWTPIQIDIQNYRTRRQMELQKLARRMADQVVATGRKQTLEPMPANERRIIHIELRKRDDVYTESAGEEPYRKVYIYPAN